MKRAAGHILLVVAFVINIPLQIGISVYGLVYVIRAFIDGSILIGIIAIPITAVCVAVAHFVVGLIFTPLNGLIALLLSKTDVETASRAEWERERKQAEKEYLDGEQAKSHAEIEHARAQLRKIYVSQGMTLQEADEKIEHDLGKATGEIVGEHKERPE